MNTGIDLGTGIVLIAILLFILRRVRTRGFLFERKQKIVTKEASAHNKDVWAQLTGVRDVRRIRSKLEMQSHTPSYFEHASSKHTKE
jgi:hypothetical protein